MTDYRGNVLVVGCNKDPEEVAEAIIGKNFDKTKMSLDAVKLSYFQWCVDTKYYKANLGIICAKLGDLMKKIPAGYVDHAEACIIYVDNNYEGLKMIKDIHSCLKNFKRFEMNILVCPYNPDVYLFDTEVNKWCTENYYDLIEMKNRNYASKGERFYADNLKSVLYTHHWPNLILKDAKSWYTDTSSPFLSDGNSPFQPKSPPCYRYYDRDTHFGKKGDKEADFDFLSAFNNLSLLREKMQQLGPKERKEKAKEVVHTFWKAIGGDSDEIDSDEEDLKEK